MAGFSFGNLFQRDNLYDDEGNLRSIGTQDYAGKYNTQILPLFHLTGTTNVTIMYTVPAGKIFYLAQYSISFTKNVAATVHSYIYKSGTAIMQWTLPTTPNQSITITSSGNFTMPIRFVAGQDLAIAISNVAGDFTCTLQGWIEDA